MLTYSDIHKIFILETEYNYILIIKKYLTVKVLIKRDIGIYYYF